MLWSEDVESGEDIVDRQIGYYVWCGLRGREDGRVWYSTLSKSSGEGLMQV